MKLFMGILTAVVAAAVALCVACTPSTAEAASYKAGALDTSLPYVVDVNPSRKAFYTLVVEAKGAPSAFKATSHGKRAKVHRVDGRSWSVKVRRGWEYKLSVRSKGGAWKSIGYRVY